ncbi:hypothetical protein Psuf_028410 [Phytohabitans suffuscus]|uniref:DUF4031 domain-containing protein n=2 Tax=Phytohabitans suffuscus TaxID=624315 RepID=A0A6F8YHT9_9ACTN|nr:hypothetical protein Psuf_028410 [Phytohabitans suffuscus]
MVYVDPPAWPARGRLWSHMISDVSYEELHAFAEMLGEPRRGFDRDHYDVPAERVPVAVWLGGRPPGVEPRDRPPAPRRGPAPSQAPRRAPVFVMPHPREASSRSRLARAGASQRSARAGRR